MTHHLDPSILRACKTLLLHNITPQHALILSACMEEPPPNMTILAELCGVSTAAMTGSIDRMVKLGMVERQPHEGDRRAIAIILTDRGSSIIAKLNATASTL